ALSALFFIGGSLSFRTVSSWQSPSSGRPGSRRYSPIFNRDRDVAGLGRRARFAVPSLTDGSPAGVKLARHHTPACYHGPRSLLARRCASYSHLESGCIKN